jgi:hypothetical protein
LTKLKTMDLAEFWTLIGKSRAADCEEHAENLSELLGRKPAQEIIDFDRLFRERLDEAYRWDLWAVAYIVNGGCSDDGFEYFRSWLIGQGRAYFEAALREPERAADNARPGAEAECEDLLYAAAGAYESKTGDSDMPRARAKAPAGPAGEPWDEDGVEELYPALAKKFA